MKGSAVYMYQPGNRLLPAATASRSRPAWAGNWLRNGHSQHFTPVSRQRQAPRFRPMPVRANPDSEEAQRIRAREELRHVVEGAREVLATATTVFPLTPFPDTITVDREKITVTRRAFFRTAEVVTARVEDVLNVTADIGPYLGSLKMTTRFFNPGKPYTINYLWRRDALKLKRIMQGYIIAAQKGIDTSALSTKELAQLLSQLGQASPYEEV